METVFTVGGSLRRVKRSARIVGAVVLSQLGGGLPLTAQAPIQIRPADGTVLVDGETAALEQFAFIAPVAGGSVLLPQPQQNVLRLYSSSGNLTWQFGRTGDGPGEFRRIAGVGTTNDAVWVADALHRRLTTVRGGRLMSTSPIPRQLRLGGGNTRVNGASILAVSPDGTLLIEAVVPGDRPFPDAWTGRSATGGDIAFVLVDSIGNVRKVLGWARDRLRCQPGQDASILPVPFCVPPLRAASANGEWLAVIEGDRSPAGGYRLRILEADGGLRADKQVQSSRHPVSEQAFNALLETYREFVNKPPGFDDALARQRPPSHYPAARSIIVANDGRVAVEVWDEEPRRRYRLFAPNGDELRGLDLPASETLGTIGAGWILTIRTDSDGIQSIVRYLHP